MNILVCDCGSSTCRALIYDSESGRVLERRAVLLEEGVFRNGGAEIDLESLWSAVRDLFRETVAGFHGKLDLVAVSSLFGYAFLDRQREPIGLGTTWIDNRAKSMAASIAGRLGERWTIAATGRRLTSEILIPKLARMAVEEPERYRRIHHVIGIKDELIRRLTGTIGIDFAHADYSGGFSPWSRCFVPEMWEAAGLNSALLPSPASATDIAGGLSPLAASEIGLMAGTPVLRGTSDGSAAMYGCGVMIPGVASLVSGTTDVLMTRATALTRSPEEVSLTVNTCMIGGGCLVGGAMGYSGGTVSWVQTLTDKGLDELSRAAEAVAPGADGALMTPSLTGERSPFWNPDHRGAWVGIGPSHGPGHLFRACLEGSAVRTALLLKRIVGAGHSVRRLNVGGGGASSPLWNQIRADSVGLEVFVSEDPEATVRGSALLCLPHISGGAVSEKRFVEVSEKWMQPASLYTPVASRGTVYRKMAERYERTVALL